MYLFIEDFSYSIYTPIIIATTARCVPSQYSGVGKARFIKEKIGLDLLE